MIPLSQKEKHRENRSNKFSRKKGHRHRWKHGSPWRERYWDKQTSSTEYIQQDMADSDEIYARNRTHKPRRNNEYAYELYRYRNFFKHKLKPNQIKENNRKQDQLERSYKRPDVLFHHKDEPEVILKKKPRWIK